MNEEEMEALVDELMYDLDERAGTLSLEDAIELYANIASRCATSAGACRDDLARRNG